ncbi:MAG: hypothetical protein DRO11_04050 [Methanobacteriota archaeon]|nr:MAG: hypothetical protein DRO11_04050 [Euryarchaeota archaeon]
MNNRNKGLKFLGLSKRASGAMATIALKCWAKLFGRVEQSWWEWLNGLQHVGLAMLAKPKP